MAAHDTVASQLATISRHLEPRLLEALRARGHDALRPSFARFLYLLWDGPRTLGDIAETLGLSRQAVSQLAGRVEASGYAERRPNPADARSRIVVITDRGRAVDDDRAREAIAKCQAAYAGIVGDAAISDFVEALGALRSAFGVPSLPAGSRANIGVLPLVALAASDQVFRSMADARHGGVRRAHVELLARIDGTGARPVDVARSLGITRQAAGATLGELAHLGYLHRRRDADDHRSVVFTPTDRGIELMADDASARHALDAWIARVLTPAQYGALTETGHRLAHALVPGRPELQRLAGSLRRRLGPIDAGHLATLLAGEDGC